MSRNKETFKQVTEKIFNCTDKECLFRKNYRPVAFAGAPEKAKILVVGINPREHPNKDKFWKIISFEKSPEKATTTTGFENYYQRCKDLVENIKNEKNDYYGYHKN